MEKILIIDFGSQYTQLILKSIRKCNVYCEVIDYNSSNMANIYDLNVRGIILSGGPDVVPESIDNDIINLRKIGCPVLGICFGAQYIAKYYMNIVKICNKFFIIVKLYLSFSSLYFI